MDMANERVGLGHRDPSSMLVSDGGETLGRDGDGLSRARSVLLTTLGVEIAVLVVTGIALFFVYRPTTSQAWSDLLPGSENVGLFSAHGLRIVHRLASWLAFPTAVAAGVVLALGGRAGVRRWTGAAVGAGIVATTLLATFTGFLLPWDQLALEAVTVGSDIRGYTKLFGSDVAFVLIGGTEVATRTVMGWLLVHTLVLGPVLVGLVALGWRQARRGRLSGGEPREVATRPG